MSAFTHHVPEDGAIFIFHAPHIGITKSGSVGEILRPGQTKASTCCGAARAALEITALLEVHAKAFGTIRVVPEIPVEQP